MSSRRRDREQKPRRTLRDIMLDSIEAGVRWSDEEVARAKAYARKVLG